MRVLKSLGAIGALLCLASTSQATIIGFANNGGSNATVPAALGSNATVDANGVTVSNGTTPDITLNWDANWDIHTSAQFLLLEQKTVGGNWDNEGNTGNARVGQLDFPNHTVGIAAAPGAAVVLNSFDFGMTSETAGTSSWLLKLTDAYSNIVWTQTVNFNTVGQPGLQGDVQTITPNYTSPGGSLTLSFDELAGRSYNTDGRVGIDNFSFNQTASVPEPASLSLIGLGALALIRRRRA